MFKFRNLFPEVKEKVSEYIFKDVISDKDIDFRFERNLSGIEGESKEELKIDIKKLKMCCT